eukprot:2409769-Pleurochrysis_carterae.AAC.2
MPFAFEVNHRHAAEAGDDALGLRHPVARALKKAEVRVDPADELVERRVEEEAVSPEVALQQRTRSLVLECE